MKILLRHYVVYSRVLRGATQPRSSPSTSSRGGLSLKAIVTPPNLSGLMTFLCFSRTVAGMMSKVCLSRMTEMRPSSGFSDSWHKV